MKTSQKTKSSLLPFILVNTFFIISTVLVAYFTLNFGTVAGQVDTGISEGGFYIATFTVDSNLLLGLTALLSLFFALKSLKTKKALPRPLLTLYLMSATSTLLTFLTVLLFLAPVRAASGRNYFDMFLGPMFFFHFLNPVLAALTLIYFPSSQKLTLKDRLLAVLPLTIYAVPYFVNVAVLKSWPDFYGVTFGGNYALIPLVLVLFGLIIFAISSFLAYCHNHKIEVK